MAFRENVKRFGLLRTGWAFLLRRVERYAGLHIWSVQTRPLSAEFHMPQEHAARFTFRRPSLDELLRASQNPELGLTPESIREACARGDICEGAFDGPNLVAYTWRTTTGAPVTKDLWLRLHAEGVRYGYKAFVLPQYRGMKLSSSNARCHDHLFVENGVTTDVGYIDLHNLASMKNAFRDPNRTLIGYAGYLQRGQRYWTFRTPGVRQYFSLET